MDRPNRYQSIYKTRGFQADIQDLTKQNVTKHRQTSRDTLMLRKRNICQATMTPIDSPRQSVSKKRAAKQPEEVGSNRMDMLKKWKAEKQKRMEQQRVNSKPVFKVHHVVDNNDYKNMDKVYGAIKGKRIATSAKKAKATPQQPRLAPSSTYKFKPPKNIKPIDAFDGNKKAKAPAIKALLGPTARVTRSQKPVMSPVQMLPTRTRKKLDFHSTNSRKEVPRKAVPLKAAVWPTLENPQASTSGSTKKSTGRKSGNRYLPPVSSSGDSSASSGGELPRPSTSRRSNKQLPRIKTPITKRPPLTRQKHVELTPKEIQRKNVTLRSKKNDSVMQDTVEAGASSPEQVTSGQKKISKSSTSSSLSSEYPAGEFNTTTNSESATSASEPKTPLSKAVNVAYVSPFVTMSRGKDNARKEFHRRSILGGTEFQDSPLAKIDVSKSTSPKAAAVYFHRILKKETDRLRTMCQKWIDYKAEQQPAEEACDMINVTVGQTELLLTKKFQQFRGLVECCETGNSEKPVTCLDLHGFWDMVVIQVDNIEKRFQNLDKLKANGWEEILPIIKPAPRKNSKKPTSKKSKSSSGLRSIIQAARLKKAAGETSQNINVILSAPCTPKSPRSRRSSLRISTLTSETKRSNDASGSSPGLTMMKVTQLAKSAEKSSRATLFNGHSGMTPKSILKTRKYKSAIHTPKAVLFKEDEDENLENDLNSSNLMVFSPVGETVHKTPTRKSSRLSKL